MAGTSHLRRADTTFGYFLLLATILQSILFQLITWLLVYPDEGNLAIAFATVFIFPYIIALILWIRSSLDNISKRTLIYRIIAWASTEAGIALSSIILVVLFSFRFFQIDMRIGTVFIILGVLFFLPFVSITTKVLELYENSTPNYRMWKPLFLNRRELSPAHLIAFFVYGIILLFIAFILWAWSVPVST
ncbi:MAG: hypothetical protein ACFFDN_48215 [Candidatus Hodarchaeota archaeon]